MECCAEIENLRVSFAGAEVLREININFQRAGVTVLLGRSGSGKTTLLRALNRLNETFDGCETSGSARLLINGSMTDIYGASAPELTELRRRVGMVFQIPNPLPMSVYKNMTLPLKLVLKKGRRECEERMESALRGVGLWDEVKYRLNHQATEFSGGQQQRLCLARTLALEPDILLLDEPTASLDKKSSELIEDLLLRLNEKYPMIVVSHNLVQALRLGKNFAVLSEGRVTKTMTANELNCSDAQRTLESYL